MILMTPIGSPPTHSLGWRIVVTMSAAILLPLLIYILITVSVNYRDARRASDRATLALAADLSKDVAARLQLVGHSMRILATIRSIDQQNWTEAQSRSREIANLDPYWRNVALIDLERGVSLFDLRTARPVVRAIDAQAAISAAHRSARRPMFSGVTRGPDGRPEIEAYLEIGHATTQRYLLRVSLDPSIVQQVLMAANLPDGVSAVVDRRGLFIARSKAWPERLGTPATSYVRDAIVRARSGLYRSITWEKLRTQTAFATIAESGWSVHVAVPSSSVDRAQSAWELWSFLAALASLSFAALLVFLAQRVIEERRVSQVRAQQAERLEAVGKLTGGIAHDFNNMLAIVIGSLDLANRRLAKGNTDVVRYIDNAMEGARRAADLTRRLLAFSRRQPLAPAPVNVNALIRSMQELLSHTLSGALTIKTNLADDLWLTFVDPGQLENAIVNLAINARDAMPDGGMLRIETSNRPAENGGSGNQIGIVVGDTGSGMTADVAARAFEPFFTTKEVGRGTGLGLSQIHGFAVQSGGDAIIASVPGEGTAVTILLPQYVESGMNAARPHIPRQDETAPAGRADEIILIVEDEDQIRLANVEALRSLGYTVRHAANAEEALSVFQTQPGIRLLLSDIVMPGMNGRELADRVSQAYPNTRILLVTGFERDQDELDESRILRKPFGIGELARRVRDTFDSPPTET